MIQADVHDNARSINTNTPLAGISDSVGFDLLDEFLARDISQSIEYAIDGGALFDVPPDPLVIFRQSLLSSIRQIEEDQKRFDLFVRFLRDGPYEGDGPIPSEIATQRLTDDETVQAVRYIYYRVVNTFQGALAELLAVGPCMRLFTDLQREGRIFADAQFHVGDATLLKAGPTGRPTKGADIIFITPSKSNRMHIEALAEVKSYALSQRRLEGQIERQITRVKRGILLRNATGGYNEASTEMGQGVGPIRIGVVPSTWRLSRNFHMESIDGKRGRLIRPPMEIPGNVDRISKVGASSWRINLRWSHEALASAAYSMTFWLMGEIGRLAFSENKPSQCDGMSPYETGRNAAKMMLYYALYRICHSDELGRKEASPAIALYNSYSFGYALGASFKDPQGRRQMMSYEDLEEIASSGVTKQGCYFHK